jgi:hypothetical protein
VVINKYMYANPIVVCTGTACPAANNVGQTDANAQIGFLDPNSTPANLNTADEIFSKELADATGGTRVVFGPLQQYNSPNSSYGTSYSILHFTQNPDCNNLKSSDFNTLVQTFPFTIDPTTNQPVYTSPNPTNPAPGLKPGKTCTVTNGILQPPCVPISIHPSTVNVFFVSQMVLPSGCPGTLSGFGKVGGNGVAINSSAVFSVPYLIDVIPHELLHNAGQPHSTSNTNLMASGGTRAVPTLSTTTPPTSNLSTGLGTSFDALTCSPLDPTTGQCAAGTQGAQVLDPSGQFNNVLGVTTTITGPTTPTSSTFLVTVSIPQTTQANLEPVIKLFWEVVPPLGFQPNTFSTNCTGCNNPDGLIVTAKNFQGNLGTDIFCGPQAPSFKCIEIDINSTPPNPAFTQPDTFTFSIQMSNSNKSTQLCDLASSDFTYLTLDQFATTSGFSSTPTCPTAPPPPSLTAASHKPDLTKAAFIPDLSLFAPASTVPCNVELLFDPTLGCPNIPTSDLCMPDPLNPGKCLVPSGGG